VLPIQGSLAEIRNVTVTTRGEILFATFCSSC
jgi:hypothetical protein